MNFGIPDLSAGREHAPDATRRRDQADNADFAALLDRSVDEPEQAEPRDNAVNRPTADAAGKSREKTSRIDPTSDEAEAESVAAIAEDPSPSAQPASPQDPASEKPSEPAPAKAQTDAQDDAPQEEIIESVVASTIPAQLPPKSVDPAPAVVAMPTKPIAPADATSAATPQPAGAEATQAASDKPATAAVPTADFADQLAAAATQPTDTPKSKQKSETPSAGEPVAKPVAPATNAAAVEPVAPSTDAASKRGTTQDNAQTAQTIVVAPQTPVPTPQTSAATQGQNANAPAPVAPPDAANAEDASLVAVLRAATPQPQAAARAGDGKPADPPPAMDALLKDADIDAAPKPAQAKNDAAPKPFGALAPGLGLAAQITSQQVPEQANAADRLAQLAAAATADKGKDAPVTTEPSKPVDAASPAKSDPQPAIVDTPAQRQAAADVSNVNAAARMARPNFHPVVTQIAAQMAQAAADGTDKINIRLSPAELGRIDVKLDFGPDGRVQAVFAAERPQTMELLQRDARDLERALQDAGLRADSGSLSFNLRGQGRDAQDEKMTGGHRQDGTPVEIATSQLQAYAAGSGGSGRLDIRI